MIADKDRADWFGASDTSTIMGNWSTKTFENWWMQKIGISTKTFQNKFTLAGTYWEHNILEFIGCNVLDRQITIPELKLRVNLDGEKDGVIYECKTHKAESEYKPPKSHLEQVRVQMYATGQQAFIVAYGLLDEDYDNYFAEVDARRLTVHKVEQDETFIRRYLQRLRYLCRCMDEGIFPTKEEFEKWTFKEQ